ncbi:MAG: class I SAM-dependent methyltransferase [Chloroflexi bacterium]|nr:class I SAM-dependent methyltransferase [Chloroflexota bacterium]
MNSYTVQKIPDYDFHIPKKFTYPLPIIIISVTAAGLLYFLLQELQPIAAGIGGGIIVLAGGVYVGIFAILKRITNLERRLKGRDKLLNGIPWQGSETVLDVGCGNGILTMGAAKRLTTGKVIGIDIWTEGSGDNRPDVFQENAKIEGVADRVSLQNEDVRQLPYDDESFDVIISGLTVHHLGFDTEKGMGEMIRVLKSGGWLAIYDEPSTVFYSAKLMRKNGLQVEKKVMGMVIANK